jgi:teichuronic acid biosynthesis glycosyltransferase TuaH
MRDLIFISLEDWDDVWRRNQFLCAEWMRRFPLMRILFVGRSRDFSHAVRHGSWAIARGPGIQRLEDFPGLTLLKPRKWWPNSVGLGRRLNQWSFLSQVRRAGESLGLRAPLLWINDHGAGHLAGRLGERAVIYDITDDWTQMPSIPEPEREWIRSADQKLCHAADLVVVCSKALERSRVGRCRRMERVPNGVDAAHYRVEGGAPVKLGERPPVFGYLGTLHGDRLDLSLVVALALRCPEARVVLCGPDYFRAEERNRLLAQPNVEILPPVPYREVPRVLQGFDVCLVPHHCSAFTESLNPIKLWEYFACGKPIASTPVAGFSDYPDLVCLGRGSEGFTAACRRALEEGGEGSKQRLREAEAHSWKKRVDQLTEIFRQEGWVGTADNSGSRGGVGRGEADGVARKRTGWLEWREVCHG